MSERTLWRWAREEGFPKPLTFQRYTAWRWDLIYGWIDERTAAASGE